MESTIQVRNVPSVVALTQLEKRSAYQLRDTAYELWSATEAQGSESIFCVIDKPEFLKNDNVKVYCPINSVDVAYHEKKYKIEVLPRALVLSTVHYGEYNHLKPTFEQMFEYIQKNNLNSSVQYRVIFHREKREWDRTKPQHKPNSDYITELQIQIFDK